MMEMKILIYVVVFFIYSVLRPFVEVILYNIFSATYGHGTDTTALYCGLCAAIFAVSAYLIARWLCKLWDKKQSANAQRGSCAEVSSESTEPEFEAADPSPTIADPTSPAPATPKLRYCKHCGSPLDPATRQCTGCGKQYFRPPVLRKKYLAIAAGVLACAAIMLLVGNLVSQKNAAEAKAEELTVRVAELESAVAEKVEQIKSRDLTIGEYMIELAKKNTEIGELKEESATYREYLDYCEMYCAYLTCSDGKISSSIYHRLDCPYTETADYLRILYIDFLEEKGFKPCPHCYG